MKFNYMLIENNLVLLLDEIKSQPKVASYISHESLSYSDEIEHFTLKSMGWFTKVLCPCLRRCRLNCLVWHR